MKGMKKPEVEIISLQAQEAITSGDIPEGDMDLGSNPF